MPVSVPPSPPPRPRMRPPRPWVPDDPPETVLPAWMYACREPHPPHRVVRPDAPPPSEPVRPRRSRGRHARHRRVRECSAEQRELIVLAALLGALLGGYACLAVTVSVCPL
ncbi:hypothetical protein JCM3263A_07490 [Thermobifida fusca]|mgnify:FL=1|jgi:hypothetical protein|uniref:Uncharacterized protein n=1 Tax=Thermobifida fusca (strain YX) TaxID=269800 RepID=Q47QV3_THEFY|nr:hypothetical protein [Thermobifida fusca]AAZ55164.1 hypothetical protein Tfu_1126 [Thermobifida fusca YX]QOS57780.1 hypothetical protein IM867_10010 [Thermobifida fusca]